MCTTWTIFNLGNFGLFINIVSSCACLQTIHHIFRPLVTGTDLDRNKIAPSIKSVIELIRMKEMYSKSNQDPEVQLLLSEVAKESCRWVSRLIKLT